jgi:hypothetical protein
VPVFSLHDGGQNASFWPLQPTELNLDFVTLLDVIAGTRAVILSLGELSHLSGGPRYVLSKRERQYLRT